MQSGGPAAVYESWIAVPLQRLINNASVQIISFYKLTIKD